MSMRSLLVARNRRSSPRTRGPRTTVSELAVLDSRLRGNKRMWVGILFTALFATTGAANAQEKAQFGRLATPEEIESWDITVEPSGAGLPRGSGTAKQGEAVYA